VGVCVPGKNQQYYAEKYGGGGWWWNTDAGKHERAKLEQRGMARETLDWLADGNKAGQQDKGGKGTLGKKGKKGEGASDKQGAKGQGGKGSAQSEKGKRGEADRLEGQGGRHERNGVVFELAEHEGARTATRALAGVRASGLG